MKIKIGIAALAVLLSGFLIFAGPSVTIDDAYIFNEILFA